MSRKSFFDMFDEDPLVVHDEENINDKRRNLRISKVAKEYIIDFDLVKAVARAGCDWNLCKRLEKDPTFIATVQELIDTIDPDIVVSRQQLLMQLKREAYDPANRGSERIAALGMLAKLLGMELQTDSAKAANAAPVVNITLTQAPNAKPPMIEVKQAEKELL